MSESADESLNKKVPPEGSRVHVRLCFVTSRLVCNWERKAGRSSIQMHVNVRWSETGKSEEMNKSTQTCPPPLLPISYPSGAHPGMDSFSLSCRLFDSERLGGRTLLPLPPPPHTHTQRQLVKYTLSRLLLKGRLCIFASKSLSSI